VTRLIRGGDGLGPKLGGIRVGVLVGMILQGEPKVRLLHRGGVGAHGHVQHLVTRGVGCGARDSARRVLGVAHRTQGAGCRAPR